MPLFRWHRSSAKLEPTDDTQKNWGIVRLNGKGSTGQNKKSAPVAATIFLDDAVTCDPGTTVDLAEDSARVNCSSINQNYSPVAALSLESHPLASNALPLSSMADIVNNSGGDTAPEEKKLVGVERFERWQRKKPRFHFGPRQNDEDEAGDTDKRDSSATASQNIITLPPKFAFIYQDGKFVEREVTNWPTSQRSLPHQRYRVMEPYATRYGRKYRRRISSQERIVTQRYRFIYLNPIYRLPRKMIEENKFRLMSRHTLRNSFEEQRLGCWPHKVDVGEKTQTKLIRKKAEKVAQKDAGNMVKHYLASRNIKQPTGAPTQDATPDATKDDAKDAPPT